MKIHYATISETGKRRKNEDAFRIVNSEDGNRWLAVVCDGMGGHAMGEVASETVSIPAKRNARTLKNETWFCHQKPNVF